MRRRVGPGVLAVVLFAVHCGRDHDATFTHDGDSAFVASIEGTYAATTKAGAGVTLAICEDTSTSAAVCIVPDIGQASDCPSECHTIRSGGRSNEESLPVEKTGCGCAGAHAEMAIVATLDLGGGTLRMSGVLDLSPSESDAYGDPRRIFASASSDRSAPSDVNGYFRNDGKLELTVRASAAARPPADVADASADASSDGGDGGAVVVVSGEKLVFTRVPNSAAAGSPCR